mmetsp:Transcript_103499/g.331841  ORF Transcript_103499/g.331841 Transcript_103499/m.331841 type:complete len:233 (+) Transcript_103499:1510-2208(+)
MVQGRPIPKKTFTELLPVTLTMDASASSSRQAAQREAKRSGMEVPRATKVMAVMESSIPVTQPKSSAKSITQVVTPPMSTKDMMKHNQPPQRLAGGRRTENANFQGTLTTCKTHSVVEGGALSSSASLSSSLSPTSVTASTMSLYHLDAPHLNESMLTIRSSHLLARRATLKRATLSFSFWIVTVSTQRSPPPSSWGSKMTPPSAPSKMSWNSSLCSPIRFGSKVMGTKARS